MGVARSSEHADIGAGGEYPRFSRAYHQRAHLRMLEAQPLERIGELDVDAEIVALEQPRFLVDIHDQRGHFAINLELPMVIASGLGLKIDTRLWLTCRIPCAGVVYLVIVVAHRLSPPRAGRSRSKPAHPCLHIAPDQSHASYAL